MPSKARDVGVGLFFVVLATVLWFSIPSQVVPSWSSFGVGSRGFPRLATAVMGFFGLLLVVVRLVGAKPPSSRTPVQDEDIQDQALGEPEGVFPQPRRFSVILAIMVAYSVLLEILGFEISTFLATFASMVYLGGRPVWKPLLLSILSTVVVSFVFARFMEVVLPSGFWA